MFLKCLYFLMILVPVLVNVAFFTLLERKILGLSQSRKGPNKVSQAGVLQPVADAVKLFLKETITPLKSNKVFMFAPGAALFLVLLMWSLSPGVAGMGGLKFSAILFLVILSLGLYPLLLAGWASNSKYALIGAVRGVAQTISYELSLALLLMSLLMSTSTLSLMEWANTSKSLAPEFAFAPLILFWLITCVAETNRSPFDFAEGESELVSGFNVEYGAGGFALLFMAEYASIMFFSFFSSMVMGSSGMTSSTGIIGVIAIMGVWVWIRATLPRLRYDKLMNIAWKSILPSALAMLMAFSSLVFWAL